MAKRFVLQKRASVCEPGEIYPRQYRAGEYIVSDEPGEGHITPHAAEVARREGWGGRPLGKKSTGSNGPELFAPAAGGSESAKNEPNENGAGKQETKPNGSENQTAVEKKAETDGQTGKGSDAQSSQQGQASEKPGSNDSAGKPESSSSTKAGG